MTAYQILSDLHPLLPATAGKLRPERLRRPHSLFFGDDERGRLSWLFARRLILTASEVAPILGIGTTGQELHRTAWSVWDEKVRARRFAKTIIGATRDAPNPTAPSVIRATAATLAAIADHLGPDAALDLEAIKWGNLLEDPIALEAGRRLGRRMIDHGRHTMLLNDDLPVPLGVTIDREIEAVLPMEPLRCAHCGYTERVHGKITEGCLGFEPLLAEGQTLADYAPQPDPRGPGLYEGKTVGAFADPAGEWRGEGPVRHIVQMQAGYAVTGWTWGHLGGLLGAPAFHLELLEVARDDGFIAWMFDKLAVFWRYVETETPPPVDDTKATGEALARFYGADDGATIDLPPESAIWAGALAKAKRDKKEAEKQEQRAKNELKKMLGAAAVGVLPGTDGKGGLSLRTVKEHVRHCEGCGAEVERRASYRPLKAFGTARELTDE